MEWIKKDEEQIPIKSWCKDIEKGATLQAENLSNHPVVKKHVALMPDCHVGYGMPIGGVIACKNAVIPNAVGVDIGCGMIAVETNINAQVFKEMKIRRDLQTEVKKNIPVGEGRSHKEVQNWNGFERYLDSLSTNRAADWPSTLDRKNLGTLGGGNHFIELQRTDCDDKEQSNIWLMVHSGSRNLGQRIAKYYNTLAKEFIEKFNIQLPDKDLAYLMADSEEGEAYIHDMNFALDYAFENRHRMMDSFKEHLYSFMNGNVEFKREINIHHNYASLEEHFNNSYWIHRKGATSAKSGEIGIIPGSMGTPSYIVRGKGNTESFMSCSHGAGRCMSRSSASKMLTIEDCDKAMEGIVFDRWGKVRSKWKKNKNNNYDLSEAPQAYKDIDQVMNAQYDLVEPLIKLLPLAVIKG